MSSSVPTEISLQLSQTLNVIEQHLSGTLLAVHLYGSAMDGGLRRYSDIDLLVTVTAPLTESVRQTLMTELLKISVPPGTSEILRALEVTVVVHDHIVPWRYPAVRQLQFGEWQREKISAGIFESEVSDPDLAILLTMVRQKSIAVAGPPADRLFDPVPESDFYRVLSDTLKLWNSPEDWSRDDRNVVLTLARMWYSAVTGMIAPKDSAADWVIERLPKEYRSVVIEAQQDYLGHGEDYPALRGNQVADVIFFLKDRITGALDSKLN